MSFLANAKAYFVGLFDSGEGSARNIVDRRKFQRRIYMRQGALVFPKRPAYPAVDCMIRDLSPAGAQIEIQATDFDETLLLGSLRLYVAEKKHERECKIVWRRGRMMGVKFEGDPLPASRDFRHPLQRG